MIAAEMKELLESKSAGVIRRMFEEGAALKQKYGEDNVFDFSIGNPDLEPPPEVLSALQEAAADRSRGCHGYMPNAGYMEARAAMAEKTAAEQGVPVSAEHVVMSVGAAGALTTVMKALLNSGDDVVVPCPYFSEYRHYVRNHGGNVVCIQTRPDFSLDAEAVRGALTEKTAAVLINSPNNPTGRVYSRQEIEELAALLSEHGRRVGRLPWLVCDEPYRAITYGGKQVAPVFPAYKNAVVVTSFAKNLSIPGERIGYLCVNPAAEDGAEMVAACILATRILGFVNAPALFQKVVAKSWNAPCDYSLYERRCREIREVMDWAGLEYAVPEGAFYLFVKVPDGWNGDDMAFTEHLKRFNILCAPGSGFGGKGWFRISYCVSEKTIRNSRDAFYKAVHGR